MPSWASGAALGPVVTVSIYDAASIGSIFFRNVALTSATWPAANRALFAPFRLSEPFLLSQLWWQNGTIVSTPNVDCGVYTADGRRLVSAGSTGQSGDSVIQTVNVTDTPLAPGLYFIGLCVSANNTGMMRSNTDVGMMRAIGMFQQALGSVTLPTTLTPAAITSSYLPSMGFTARSFV